MPIVFPNGPEDPKFEHTVVDAIFKTCKVCGETKPLTSANFQMHSHSKDGFTSTCNDCRKKGNRPGRPKKNKTLMEVFKDEKLGPSKIRFDEYANPKTLSKEAKIKIAHEMTSPDQQALELIESLFPDGIQPRQYKGLLKTIKLMLKMEG